MRWPIIRLIWQREIRDQLRDRRTLFTIVALPLFLYPALSFLVLQFSVQLLRQPSTVGILLPPEAPQDFPPHPEAKPSQTVAPALSWLALAPGPGSAATERVLGTAALAQASHLNFALPLLIENGQVAPQFVRRQKEGLPIFAGAIPMQFRFLDVSTEEAEKQLASKEVDVLLSSSPDFLDKFQKGEQTALQLKVRPSDDRSRRAAEQLSILLGRWKQHLKEIRLKGKGLPPNFDDPFVVQDNNRGKSEETQAAETMLDLLVRTFPFLLVMWSLIGALHPAIDLCAGEKERGTMETLLISPATREEIVYGKFLTIWVFSASTSTLHLLSIFFSTWLLRSYLPQGAVTLPALFWCVVLVLPLSALFSAVTLAIGAYARSTKEGQYYLMPMFWVTMPLMLLTMAPGVELNQFYSMIPVTGVALLMQRLMIAPNLAAVPWFYFVPVFGTVVLYSWLALRWAIWQFQREEVLFREAERLQLGLWLRALFKRSEIIPSLGQAVFAFVLLFALRRLSLDLGGGMPLLVRNTVIALAFVATPTLLMALLLTTRPRLTLRLFLPHPGYLLIPVLLLPLAELVLALLNQLPALFTLLQGRRIFVDEAYRQLGEDAGAAFWWYSLLVLGLLPAVCEALGFQGFILSGLRRRLSLWPALLLCGFLFGVYHMHVFLLAPYFLLGVAAGILTLRSGSVLPAALLHTGCVLLLLYDPLSATAPTAETPAVNSGWLTLLVLASVVSTALAGVLLWRLPSETPLGLPSLPWTGARKNQSS